MSNKLKNILCALFYDNSIQCEFVTWHQLFSNYIKCSFILEECSNTTRPLKKLYLILQTCIVPIFYWHYVSTVWKNKIIIKRLLTE